VVLEPFFPSDPDEDFLEGDFLAPSCDLLDTFSSEEVGDLLRSECRDPLTEDFSLDFCFLLADLLNFSDTDPD